MKQYKLIAGPTTSQILGKEGSNADAVRSFEAIIQTNAAEGWTYHSMERISTSKTTGCISKTTVETTFYMLVFVKE